MAIFDINTIKGWFVTGAKPLQEQFWGWIDSFRHSSVLINLNDLAPDVVAALNAGGSGGSGSDGVGITNAAVNGSGHLIITYSNATTNDAGYVIGATGAAGATGATGATGANGRGITGVSVDGSGNLIITYSDSSTVTAGYVVGPQGATGATGAAGAAGQGFNFRGAWAASTAYAPYDIVTNGGSTYECSTGFTSGATFNAANWNLVAAKGADGTGGAGTEDYFILKDTVTATRYKFTMTNGDLVSVAI